MSDPLIEQTYCYVAADPAQPGAAWAAVIIGMPFDPERSANFCAEQIKSGAIIQHVNIERAREMLSAWKRPKQNQGDLL